MERIERHTIPASASLREALSALNALSGGNMTLFAVDESGILAGSLTDGDIRRALLAGRDVEARVADACRRDCMRLSPDSDRYATVAQARDRGIRLLPQIDAGGRISRLLDLSEVKALLPVEAVLMAGGRGERLRPLTADTPKPLLPVRGKAIIDHNIDALMACGIERIFVTVNYLREQLEDHCADPRFKGRIRCVAEPRRLGTMGSVALCGRFGQETVLVMNSDLLTDIDFEKMWLAHRRSGAALTMAAVSYSVAVPFAILDCEGRRVKGLVEKPTYNYFANAGIYMMRREVAESIPAGEYLDATDLIDSLIEQGEKVEYFPIEGTWIDIGSPADYAKANEQS